MSRRPTGPGLVPVDKPVGPTSHDMIRVARAALGTRRIGHSGTLDPFASGLLLLGVDRGTRLLEFLSGLDKEYEASARLGIVTTTDDPEGEVMEECSVPSDLSLEDLRAALEGIRTRGSQRPPSYSAKRVEGERAYRKARRGEALDLPPVPVEIHALELGTFDPPHLFFRVRCSTGTYIRSIARDLGEALGIGAHLVSLRRTRIGPFSVSDALSPDALAEPESVARHWIEPARALGHLPALQVDSDLARRLVHGQSPGLEEFPEGGELAQGLPVAVHQGDLLVCVARREGERLRPRKVFATLEETLG